MFRLRDPQGLTNSKLFDQRTFYQAFMKDLGRCNQQVIIESPFVTSNRAARILPALNELRKRGVQVVINTREPSEHDQLHLELQAIEAIEKLQRIGIQVLFTGGHHRKLAILDGRILWEGSLNILSQNTS